MARLTIDSIKELTYDAIVIGSGVSGGWAAKELTEKGLRVLMLERGKQLEHVTDYENALKAPWELQIQRDADHRADRVAPEAGARLSVQRDDGEVLVQGLRFALPRGAALRLVPAEHRRRKIDHVGPAVVSAERSSISRRTSATASPWTGRSATRTSRRGIPTSRKFAGISGEKLGLPQLPDGEFLPPMEMYFVEKEVRKRIEKTSPAA